MVVYDHIWNLVTNTALADLVHEKTIKREVLNINTGNHKIINKVHKN